MDEDIEQLAYMIGAKITQEEWIEYNKHKDEVMEFIAKVVDLAMMIFRNPIEGKTWVIGKSIETFMQDLCDKFNVKITYDFRVEPFDTCPRCGRKLF